MKKKEEFKREYRIWKAMRARCNAPCYKDSIYQVQNISVCERWNSFDLFIEDMGPCPKGYSIDRIDTYGNYCPENCRWADNKTQASNRGNFNKKYSYKGEEHCLKDWANILGIKYLTLYMRINRHPELTFEETISYKDPRTEKILWEGNYYTRLELCTMYNIPLQNFYDRFHKGWSIEKILTTPINYKI